MSTTVKLLILVIFGWIIALLGYGIYSTWQSAGVHFSWFRLFITAVGTIAIGIASLLALYALTEGDDE